jgi:DNA-binding NarL/FixJ family response regulator
MDAPNIRIVLCHAHDGLRTGLRYLFEAADGIDVVASVDHGDEGVDAVARLSPDVILMDLAMPRIDAVATSRRIAELRPRTSVLVMTGFPEPKRIRAVIEAGASGYVLKDATPDSLLYAVRAAAQR